jgi:GNAT superfamily N-acetyltransferase
MIWSVPMPADQEHRGESDVFPLRSADDARSVARWIFDEWAQHEPGITWDRCLGDVLASLETSRGIPRYFACRRDGTLVGCASIIASDLPTRPELGPWLANVYVVPEMRGRGIGIELVDRATRHAAAETATLYLYTFDRVSLYAKLGWEVFALDRYVDRPITIMSKRLRAE